MNIRTTYRGSGILNLEGMSLSRLSFYERYGKRAVDVVLSIFGLVIFSPVFIISAILIKFDNHGHVLFRQKRMGKGGRVFETIKFRTMAVDEGKEELQFTPGDKQRITKIGKFLRIHKIDELPNLINVLKGEMSFVGPRPEVPKYLDYYQGEKGEILSIKPGITDFASIKYRDEEELLANSKMPEKTYIEKILPDKLRLDLHYLRNISFQKDLQIILNTIKVVLFGR